MARYVALLRGINVGGKRRVLMKELRGLCEDLGFTAPATYLQSGNLVLSAEQNTATVAHVLQEGIAERFGHADVPVLVFSARSYRAMAKAHPFEGKGADPKALHVVFLAKKPSAAQVREVQAVSSGDDEVSFDKRAAYLHLPRGVAKTKLSQTLFEKKLKMTATGRNWKTTRALLDLLVG